MTVAGIIFSNIHDRSIPGLTQIRTMGSVPFGCRYRLIDFALSNMVNSGVSRIGVVTHYNYGSLMEHIGAGKDWDLARRSGGVTILPPFFTASASDGAKLYSNRLEAVKNIYTFLSELSDDYVVFSDCDSVCNIDLSEVIATHIETGADMTCVTKNSFVFGTDRSDDAIVKSDSDGRITEIYTADSSENGYYDIMLNINVFNRDYLLSLILDSVAHNYSSFRRELLPRRIPIDNIRIFKYNGYFSAIKSMRDYFRCNMDLLSPEPASALFAISSRPVLTHVYNSPPTYYAPGSSVRSSLIADGCRIEGSVENSIIFRGVKIGRGAVVKNSILMRDTVCGDNVQLNCVITDRNVVIHDRRCLSGHENLPFFIDPDTRV